MLAEKEKRRKVYVFRHIAADFYMVVDADDTYPQPLSSTRTFLVGAIMHVLKKQHAERLEHHLILLNEMNKEEYFDRQVI